MKTALVLTGNLRTFFMNLKGSPLRVCDLILKNIVIPNNTDVFICTDTNDFYLNDCQYFNSKIDIVNNDQFRLHTKVQLIDHNQAKEMLERELKAFFGDRLKACIIGEEEDLSQDPKCKLLQEANEQGSSPIMITGQYKKLLKCYDSIQSFEETNGKYDFIFKTRFDCVISSPLKLSDYNFSDTDVYVPSVKGPIIYDFCAFGKSDAMKKYISLYHNLGMTLQGGQMFIQECRKDGAVVYFGNNKDNKEICPICKSGDNLCVGNVTVASEYHLYFMFNKEKIRYKNFNCHVFIHRYRDVAYNNTIDNIIQNELKLNGVTVVNHTPTAEFSVKKY